MRNLNLKNLLSLLSLGALVVGCSARNIVEESNPYLDPDPVTNVQPKKGEDPQAKEQWNLAKIGSQTAGNQEGSRRIKIAILSTGVDYTHEDLAQNIFVNRAEWMAETNGRQNARDNVDNDTNGYTDDFIGYDFVENDGLPFDRNGAGTAMAGVVGAATGNSLGIKGVVPDVSIVPVKYIDESGHVLLPNLFKALNYALAMKVDLVLLQTPSYTFGSTAMKPGMRGTLAQMEKEMLNMTISDLGKAGIPVVASAGNSNAVVGGTPGSLAAELAKHTNVIVVTSVDQADVRPFLANYSKEKVHTSAPGKDVLTTQPGNQYAKLSSTSLAAAHVAGALALAINQTYGRLEPRKLVEGLLSPEASDPLASSFETIGGNRLNVTKYLNYLGK
jgi:serine protease